MNAGSRRRGPITPQPGARLFGGRIRVATTSSIAVVVAALLVACGATASGSTTPTVPSPPASTLAVPTPSGLSYAALGASETYGVGASPTSTAYAYLIRDMLKLGPQTFADVGIPATTLADAFTTELTNALAVHPTVCTVFFGVNDVRDRVPVEQFQRDLTDLVKTLTRTGAHVLIIGMPDLTQLPAVRAANLPDLAGIAPAWNAAMRSVAAATGARFLALDGFSSEIASHPEYLSSDGLHPSTAGHRHLAQIIFAALQSDGMLP